MFQAIDSKKCFNSYWLWTQRYREYEYRVHFIFNGLDVLDVLKYLSRSGDDIGGRVLLILCLRATIVHCNTRLDEEADYTHIIKFSSPIILQVVFDADLGLAIESLPNGTSTQSLWAVI